MHLRRWTSPLVAVLLVAPVLGMATAAGISLDQSVHIQDVQPLGLNCGPSDLHPLVAAGSAACLSLVLANSHAHAVTVAVRVELHDQESTPLAASSATVCDLPPEARHRCYPTTMVPLDAPTGIVSALVVVLNSTTSLAYDSAFVRDAFVVSEVDEPLTQTAASSPGASIEANSATPSTLFLVIVVYIFTYLVRRGHWIESDYQKTKPWQFVRAKPLNLGVLGLILVSALPALTFLVVDDAVEAFSVLYVSWNVLAFVAGPMLVAFGVIVWQDVKLDRARPRQFEAPATGERGDEQ